MTVPLMQVPFTIKIATLLVPGTVKDISTDFGIAADDLNRSEIVYISTDQPLAITTDGTTTPSATVAGVYINALSTTLITSNTDIKRLKFIKTGVSDCNVTVTLLAAT